MAAALLEQYGGGRIVVLSAGSQPADELNPAVVAAMAEVGIDLSGRTPAKLATESVEAADVVVTLGCGDSCPVFPGTRYLDWQLDDPAGRDIDGVRPIRDEIDQLVRALALELLH